MKKNYEKPLAKKVTFDYQKVVAASQNCIWHTPKRESVEGCEIVIVGRQVSTLAFDENYCGWLTPDRS